MGRPAKSAEMRTGHMTKSEREGREIAQNAVRGYADKIKPPSHLTKEQRAIFKKIVGELKESGILSNLDVYVLGNCAIAIDRVREYDRMIIEKPELLLDKDAIRNRNTCVSEFYRCCNELCLSPQARAKIGAANLVKRQAAADPIAQALGGGT